MSILLILYEISDKSVNNFWAGQAWIGDAADGIANDVRFLCRGLKDDIPAQLYKEKDAIVMCYRNEEDLTSIKRHISQLKHHGTGNTPIILVAASEEAVKLESEVTEIVQDFSDFSHTVNVVACPQMSKAISVEQRDGLLLSVAESVKRQPKQQELERQMEKFETRVESEVLPCLAKVAKKLRKQSASANILFVKKLSTVLPLADAIDNFITSISPQDNKTTQDKQLQQFQERINQEYNHKTQKDERLKIAIGRINTAINNYTQCIDPNMLKNNQVNNDNNNDGQPGERSPSPTKKR